MTSKVILGKKFYGCCRYVMTKKGAVVLAANGVRTDKFANTAKDFEIIRALRPGRKEVVVHISGNFAYEDREALTDQRMTEIAQALIKKLGLEKNQAIVVRHHDAKHEHFHLVSSLVSFDSEVVSNWYIKNRAARACDEIEAEFNLTVARGHGKGATISDKSPHKNRIKCEIKEAVTAGIESGVRSFDDLSNYLVSHGIELRIQYQSTGRVNGVSFKKDSIAFKGSAIDKSFSFKGLSNGFQVENHINRLSNANQIDYER